MGESLKGPELRVIGRRCLDGRLVAPSPKVVLSGRPCATRRGAFHVDCLAAIARSRFTASASSPILLPLVHGPGVA
jgi:hypothetical protein